MPPPLYKTVAMDQFLVFARGQLEFKDSDPHCELFRAFADSRGLGLEERLWLCLLFMSYYQDGSCYAAWQAPGVPGREVLPPHEGYPISYQRRNLFGGKVRGHHEAIYEIPSLAEYFDVTSWDGLVAKLEGIHGNGRWASYTTAEMVVKVAGLPIVPDTFHIDGSTGPSEGLAFLGVPASEQGARWVKRKLEHEGIDARDEVCESFLCNWSRVCKADFYLGHNIDRQQGRLIKAADATGVDVSELMGLRAGIYDPRTTGEGNGWVTVDAARKGYYVASGKIIMPWEMRDVRLPKVPRVRKDRSKKAPGGAAGGGDDALLG